MESEIRQLEDRLRLAMLAGDVGELDALIDDRLLFVGPDGGVYRKEEDLELHRSGAEKLARVDLREVRIEPHGTTAVAVVVADLEGVFKGEEFEGRYRYIRTWVRSGAAWRIIAGSVCALLPERAASP
jgi:hypothetical protein